MQRITPDQAHPLFDTAATRRLEQAMAAALPPHTLMQRAGRAVAQLAQALAPHARTVWIACGPGNNGGDGLEAATHLARSDRQVIITWLGSPEALPEDARKSWDKARNTAYITWSDTPPEHLTPQDLCIDALLGIGVRASHTPTSHQPASTPSAAGSLLAQWLTQLHTCKAPVLAVDVPSGLDADTGQYAPGLEAAASEGLTGGAGARYTLSLLTLKPGLFTALGRDAAGQVWLDDLSTPSHPRQPHRHVQENREEPPTAWLAGPPARAQRHHASHKGSYGDVAIVGGEGLAQRGMGMTGAALLAASAALHAGAGRVLVSLLDPAETAEISAQPELMLRRFEALELETLTVVCGCGGGQAVRNVLPAVLQRAGPLVLDADALNALGAEGSLQQVLKARAARQHPTVLTPHPLEAARLLHTHTAQMQAHRLAAAQQLARQFQCVVVLKGSGTVIASPQGTPIVNPTGNARLATAGTGDVLAGMIGAHLAQGMPPEQAAMAAVFAHGQAADQWPAQMPLTAGTLAQRLA
jgi:hydroxyethylthiazole kinase-like uncharacterized protein yjeF